jgi:hypothetical protein
VSAGQFVLAAALATVCGGQSAAPPAPDLKQKIQVNFVNSCRPSAAEADEIRRALAQLKERPTFSADFEISRGVTTLTEEEARATGAPEGSASSPSAWVRVRHEFAPRSPLTDAQYSLSIAGGAVSEALALHLRDTREVLQVLLSDTVTGTADQVLRTGTPPDRIRIERFGRSSLVLARCATLDQSSYEPVFAAAREIFENYRRAMAVRKTVPGELSRLPAHKESKSTPVNH